MKLANQPKLSRHAQKMLAQVRQHFGKAETRNKGEKTYKRHKSNMSRIARHLVANGYQDARDLKLKTYRAIMDEAKEEGLSKSALESLHSTCRKLSAGIGKPTMIPRKSSDSGAMGTKDYYRTRNERVKPQHHTSWEARMALQAKIEAKDKAAGIAASMSYHSGVRKEESLASCEFLKKCSDGKLYTTVGVRQAGEYRQIGFQQMRYAFSGNRKDAAFERDYVKTMRTGQEYIVAIWTKNGKLRLIPVFDREQRATAIAAQQYIRDNKKLARELGSEVKVKSVITPGKTRNQGYDHLEYVLRCCGMTKKEAGFSLHADRTEFNLRMKAAGFSPEERILALGHNDLRKLANYGG